MGSSRKSLRKTRKSLITFKPLAQGRFRCNQTGKIVPKSQTSGYRVAQENLLFQRTQTRPDLLEESFPIREQSQISLLKASMDSDGDVQCPHCREWNFRVKEGEKICVNCGKRFLVTPRESYLRSLW